jgi:hypothetical protein
MNFARIGVLVQKGPGGHENSRRAKAALYGAMIDEGLLQRIQLALSHTQAFHS